MTARTPLCLHENWLTFWPCHVVRATPRRQGTIFLWRYINSWGDEQGSSYRSVHTSRNWCWPLLNKLPSGSCPFFACPTDSLVRCLSSLRFPILTRRSICAQKTNLKGITALVERVFKTTIDPLESPGLAKVGGVGLLPTMNNIHAHCGRLAFTVCLWCSFSWQWLLNFSRSKWALVAVHLHILRNLLSFCQRPMCALFMQILVTASPFDLTRPNSWGSSRCWLPGPGASSQLGRPSSW